MAGPRIRMPGQRIVSRLVDDARKIHLDRGDLRVKRRLEAV